MPGTRAREAPPAAAAITVACFTLELLWLLWPRHWPPLRVRIATRSNLQAQRAALSRHTLAKLSFATIAHISCLQGHRRAVRARVPTTGRRSSSSTSRRCARRGACSRSITVRRC